MWVATQQDYIPDNIELYLTTHDMPTLRQILRGKRLDQDIHDFPRHRIVNLLCKLVPNKNWWESLNKGLTNEEVMSIIESVKSAGGGNWNM